MSAKAQRPKFHWLICVDRDARPGLPSDTPMQGPTSNLCENAGRPPMLGLRLVSLLVVAMCASPLCAALPKPKKHENLHHQIDHLEKVWRDAVLRSNTAEMSALLARDYTAITPNGTLQTKQDTLANLRSGKLHFTTINISDRKIRFYGNTAVVTSRARVEGMKDNSPISGNFRYTRVYVRNAQGQWKIVSFEASRIHNNTRAFR